MTAAIAEWRPAKRRLLKRWWVRISIAAGSSLLAAVIACYLLPQQVLTVDSGHIKADALLVLGGGSLEPPQRAAGLFKRGEAPLSICTGIGDADANEACLTNLGVLASAINLEPKSHSTRENAEFAIAILPAKHLKSAIIVTSWYHSRRALACFEHYAPDINFYSRPSYMGFPKAEWNSEGISGYVRVEYVKILGYWVRYGVCPL